MRGSHCLCCSVLYFGYCTYNVPFCSEAVDASQEWFEDLFVSKICLMEIFFVEEHVFEDFFVEEHCFSKNFVFGDFLFEEFCVLNILFFEYFF